MEPRKWAPGNIHCASNSGVLGEGVWFPYIIMMRVITGTGEKTVDGRKIKYEIQSGFYRWELEHIATVWDVETSLSVEGGATASPNATLERAIDKLFVLLKEKGHLEPKQDSLQIEPPPLKEDPQLQPPSHSLAPTIDTPDPTIAVSKTAESLPDVLPESNNSLYTGIITNNRLVLATTIMIVIGLAIAANVPKSLCSGIITDTGLKLATTTIIIGVVVAVIIKSFCHKTEKPASPVKWQRSGSSSGSICLTDEPSAPMLNNIVGAHIHPDWYLFATQLGLSDAILRGIERNEADTKHCFVKAMEHWKASPPPDKPFTWETIVTTLESPYINNNELASKIRSFT